MAILRTSGQPFALPANGNHETRVCPAVCAPSIWRRWKPYHGSEFASAGVLGNRGSRLWFRFEHAADRLRALREAAYFDAGVEHGTAAARADEAKGGSRAVRRLAERLVVEALRGGVTRDEAAAAAVLVGWEMRVGRVSRGIVAVNLDIPLLGQAPPQDLLRRSTRLDEAIPELAWVDKKVLANHPEVMGRFAWVTYLRRCTETMPRRLEMFYFHQFWFFPRDQNEEVEITGFFRPRMDLMKRRFLNM